MEKKKGINDEEKFDFEKALKRLEKIVEELENASPPLPKALSLFQEGKKLSQMCDKELSRFEQKVQKILEQEKGNITLEDFAPMDEGESIPETEDKEDS